MSFKNGNDDVIEKIGIYWIYLNRVVAYEFEDKKLGKVITVFVTNVFCS